MEWAERQRQEGNKLYKEGDFRAALDVYLTCLVAKTNEKEFVTLVFLPVMNNLAQCTLQLKMYRKAQEFCSLALDEIGDEQTSSLSDQQQLVAKLYFRRGRAKRLSADYEGAKSDLGLAIELLEEETTEYRSVQREMQLIERAELEERRNEKRQERAMQRLLGSNAERLATANGTRVNENGETKSMRHDLSSGFYLDGVDNKRTYSTLTAKRRTDDEATAELEPKQSCWRWYMSMVGRVTEKLLIVLGDEEYTDRNDDNGLDRRRKDE